MTQTNYISKLGQALTLTAALAFAGNAIAGEKLSDVLNKPTKAPVRRTYYTVQEEPCQKLTRSDLEFKTQIRYADSKTHSIEEAIDLKRSNNSRVPITNVQEIIPAPMPEQNNISPYYQQQFAQPFQQPMPSPSRIQSDLPTQNILIGYQLESVPQIVQTWCYKNIVTTPMPIATALRAVLGIRPVIPDWRKATVPYLRSHIVWNQVAKPVYTSAPAIIQPQYTLPAPKPCMPVQPMPPACRQILTTPAPPVPYPREF